MNSYRDEYTINPESEWKIKHDTQNWKQLAAVYYMIDGKFTDQPIPVSRAYLSNKVLGVTINEKPKKPKHATPRKGVADAKRERKYLIVGSKAWNERFLKYDWNGHEFGERRRRQLPKSMNTVEKRRQTRRNNFFTLFDRKVAEGRLNDAIDSILSRVCTHVLSHRGGRHVQGVGERETNQEGLSSQQRL